VEEGLPQALRSGLVRKNFSLTGLLSAVVMVGVFVLVARSLTGNPSGIGVRAPGPVAVDHGTPPDGVNLLYLHDPNMPAWLIGYDWSGKVRGTVRFNPGQGGTMAPDGQSFVMNAGGKGGSGTFFDNVGQPFPWQGGVLEYASNVWADDSRHMCTVSLDQQTFEWALNTQLPTEPIKKVAVIARDPGAGQSGISLLACSIHNDLAIAVRTTIAWPAELWVIRLSDGSVLAHHTYPFQELYPLVASADGNYLGENVITTQAKTGAAVTARIRRVSDWTIVATLPANDGALGFSGDGSIVLVSTEPTMNPEPRRFEIVDWKAGRVIWRNPTKTLASFTAEPGGTSFALALQRPQSPTVNYPDPARDVTIVRGDGTSTTLAERFYQAAW
jgi:hypothetical protein